MLGWGILRENEKLFSISKIFGYIYKLRGKWAAEDGRLDEQT